MEFLNTRNWIQFACIDDLWFKWILKLALEFLFCKNLKFSKKSDLYGLYDINLSLSIVFGYSLFQIQEINLFSLWITFLSFEESASARPWFWLVKKVTHLLRSTFAPADWLRGILKGFGSWERERNIIINTILPLILYWYF